MMHGQKNIKLIYTCDCKCCCFHRILCWHPKCNLCTRKSGKSW